MRRPDPIKVRPITVRPIKVRSRKASGGFTLVEVIVASVILSLIMLATVSALSTFGRTYDRLRLSTERTSEMREVSHFLRLALRDAVPDIATFSGAGAAVSWATPLDRAGSAGGIQYLRLVQADDALLLSFAPYDYLASADMEPEWGALIDNYVLVDSVQSVNFSYRARANEDWTPEFNPEANSTIPYAVSVQIVAEDEPWPPIIVNFEGHQL